MAFFEELSPEEAERFKDRFAAAADDSIDLFKSRLIEVGGLSPTDFDYTPESLSRIFAALLPFLLSDSDPNHWADGPIPVWGDYSSRPRHQMWIVDGWIRYYARILELSGRLWWEWERDEDVATVNQPVLVGFSSNRRLAPISGAPSSVLVNAARKRQPAAVKTSIDTWLSRVPRPEETPHLPVWFDGYTADDVGVLVAQESGLEVDALWPYEPMDFNGAWRIDLVEGVDIVLGSGSTQRLLEHLRTLSEVEAAGWGGEDMLVARAPALSSRDLRDVVLWWLNDRWAKERKRRSAE